MGGYKYRPSNNKKRHTQKTKRKDRKESKIIKNL